MSVSFLPEIQTLRKTLLKWKEEVLNYFSSRLTNARLEGFNCKASALKRRAYGYRNPENYSHMSELIGREQQKLRQRKVRFSIV